MDTWAIQAAAHASLTSGFNYAPIPVVGAASMNSFALGAGLVVLAFAATRVSRQFDPLRRPMRKSRPKKRVDARLTKMLADHADEQKPTAEPAHGSADEIFWPPKRSSDSSSGGYQSKHRLPGPARPPQRERERRAPRHAAPSTRFSAR